MTSNSINDIPQRNVYVPLSLTPFLQNLQSTINVVNYVRMYKIMLIGQRMSQLRYRPISTKISDMHA